MPLLHCVLEDQAKQDRILFQRAIRGGLIVLGALRRRCRKYSRNSCGVTSVTSRARQNGPTAPHFVSW